MLSIGAAFTNRLVIFCPTLNNEKGEYSNRRRRQFNASLPQDLVNSNHKLRVRVKYVEERLRMRSQNGVWNSCEATGRTRNTATRFCVLFDTDAQKKIGFRFNHPLAKPRSIDNFTGKEHLPFFIQIVSPFRR